MPAGKDGGKNLLDDLLLSNDYFLQFLQHQLTVLTEFL
jgi:hypothetical protein